jgi:hypothetical protein
MRTGTPWLIRAAFTAIAPAHLREELLLDLGAAHAERARARGPGAADAWAWSELARAWVPLLAARCARPGFAHGLLAVLVGVGLAAVVALTAVRAWGVLLSFVPWRASHPPGPFPIALALAAVTAAAWAGAGLVHRSCTPRRSP